MTALVLALAPASLVAGDRRQIHETFDLAPGQQVALDFPIGSLEVEGWDGSEVKVEVEARCRRDSRRCERRLEELELRSKSSSRRLALEVDADGSWRGTDMELEAVVRVPRRAPRSIDMGIGELRAEPLGEIPDSADRRLAEIDIEDIVLPRKSGNDVRIEMGIGEVEVRMAEAAVGSVSLDAGIGESRLDGPSARVEERRKLLIGSELSWDGDGRARIDVELGIGEISVDLG